MKPLLVYEKNTIPLSDTQELFDILDDELDGQDYAALYPANKQKILQKLNDTLMGNSGRQGIFRFGYVDEETTLRFYGGLDKVYAFIPLGKGEVYFDEPSNPSELEIRQSFNYGDLMIFKDVSESIPITIESPDAPIYYLYWYLENRDAFGKLYTSSGILYDVVKGYVNVADYMVSNGMNPNKLLGYLDDFEYIEDVVAVVDYLLSWGASTGVIIPYLDEVYLNSDTGVLRRLLPKVEKDITLDYLRRSAREDNLDMVKFLVSMGNLKSEDLNVALRVAKRSGSIQVANYLFSS